MLIILTLLSEKAQHTFANCLHGSPIVILEAMGADDILDNSADRALSWIALKGDPGEAMRSPALDHPKAMTKDSLLFCAA